MSNGVSLHELAISLSKGRKTSDRQSDDLCSICSDGGELLLCDTCPRAFHRGNIIMHLCLVCSVNPPYIHLGMRASRYLFDGGMDGLTM
jgi:hypothetical protein